MNYIKLTTNLPNPTNIYRSQPTRFVRFVRLVFEKTYSRLNYIKMTTNLPNPTNTYRSQPKRFVRFVRFVFEKNILASELY